MPAYLEVTAGGKTSHVTCGPIVTLGRDASNTIQIKDPLISRNHALIRSLGMEQYYVLDGGSRNGTFLNELRISTPTQLKSGDVVTLGNTKLVFRQVSAADSAHGGGEDMGETISFVRNDIKSIAVLVADIRGFTDMSGKVPITTLSSLMSKWFQAVQNIVEKNGGRVDKFIGDCVMAVWELEPDPKKAVKMALRSGHEISTLTTALGEEYPDITEPLRLGVGLNCGQAAMGVGTDNTAIGDTVNLAFRLETATKDLKVEVVVGEAVSVHLPPEITKDREKSITVKGKSVPVKVCALNFADMKSLIAD